MMRITAKLVPLARILPLRDLYRREMNCQIVHDSLHARGHFDSWLLSIDGEVAGYGCVGGYRESPRVTVKELHVLPGYRDASFALFDALVRASGATRMEVQTNDRLLTLLFHDRVPAYERVKMLFEDGAVTRLVIANAEVRPASASEHEGHVEADQGAEGERQLVIDGTVVAAGGIMLHYNPPWADIYMEVAEPFRRRGHGSFLVQELKRVCYESGRVPAARCDPANAASRATLQRAGFIPAAFILGGTLDPQRMGPG